MTARYKKSFSIFKNHIRGFTLVELLVVMAIISLLATVILGGFRASQRRSRDTARKSDLKQISNALEMFYSDYEHYPLSNSGKIVGCPHPSTSCDWGTSKFTDGKTDYFQVLPADITSGTYYWYQADASGTRYQLFAHLENSEDPGCTNVGCTEIQQINYGGYTCGEDCNFAVTSANTSATDDLTL